MAPPPHQDCWPGRAWPLGATFDGQGVNFAVYSETAEAIEVCLFDPQEPDRQVARLELSERTHHVFHGHVPGLKPGALYGLRAHGPWAPERGLRFNPAKLLVDPYARALHGQVDHSGPLQGHRVEGGRHVPDGRDSAPAVPRCVVVDGAFDWGDDRRPHVAMRRTVLYEAHVKGLTRLHPAVPPELRGTYLGMAHPAVLEHLTSLGVTTVELLPVHAAVSEGFLVEKGLSNYWGYSTLNYFSPDQRFAASQAPGQQVAEFKQLVKALHAAGLEVILDVVYNHTCEGNHLGPTLAYRGLDNPTYYWLDEHDASRYRDFTGTGNSLDASHPQTLKLILDSLRAWVQDFHVDGFRFDLCTTLARSGQGDFDPRNDFFATVYQDPLLATVKLVAEPWDVGPGGYRLGNYPAMFGEWNDRYRQTVRRFWRGDFGQLADLGYRLTGSSDYFRLSGRGPPASVNYVTCHDGFTLRDLVSYSRKHNEANGEGNRDGSDENHSAHWGAEGPVDDALINALRDRMSRNLLATLFLSVGTPLLLAGDEFGRTQRGNNNAYCQDNDVSWVHWDFDERGRSLLAFTRAAIALRASQPVLQRRSFFFGRPPEDARSRDLIWYLPSGRELERGDWENPELRCVGMFLGGDATAMRGPRGERVVGDTLLMWFNALGEAQPCQVPGKESWEVLLDTSRDRPPPSVSVQGTLLLPPRAVVVLRQRHPDSGLGG